MAITGAPQHRRYGEEYESLISSSLREKIEQVRESARKKEWREDRLARVRLEDWLFTVRR
ncbi:MAG: hypothetical protein LBD99_03465 [Candidatus Margulisbacteria bacterium]|jgi:ribosome recycling factor|nr:hypothetical protein [Candidatus Margulisiibacteriota bacterium]